MCSRILLYLMLIGIIHAGDAISCGTPVPITGDQFNYLVQIIHYDAEEIGYCTGAIIDSTHILTAAHCFFDPFDGGAIIITGSVHLTSITTIKRIVSKIHLHEEYNFLGYACNRWGKTKAWIRTACQCIKGKPETSVVENDIAVLTLSEALPLGDRLRAVNLPDADALPFCDFCDFAGWGQTELEGPISQWLFSTKMMILTFEDCRALGAKYAFNEFCAMDPNEEACPLEGDSGAPLVFNNTIYGVFSGGQRDPTYPNIFSKVFDHLDFIRRALRD